MNPKRVGPSRTQLKWASRRVRRVHAQLALENGRRNIRNRRGRGGAAGSRSAGEGTGWRSVERAELAASKKTLATNALEQCALIFAGWLRQYDVERRTTASTGRRPVRASNRSAVTHQSHPFGSNLRAQYK